jgi:hypothetical protein
MNHIPSYPRFSTSPSASAKVADLTCCSPDIDSPSRTKCAFVQNSCQEHCCMPSLRQRMSHYDSYLGPHTSANGKITISCAQRNCRPISNNVEDTSPARHPTLYFAVPSDDPARYLVPYHLLLRVPWLLRSDYCRRRLTLLLPIERSGIRVMTLVNTRVVDDNTTCLVDPTLYTSRLNPATCPHLSGGIHKARFQKGISKGTTL